MLMVGFSFIPTMGGIGTKKYISVEHQIWMSYVCGEDDTTPPVTTCTLDPAEPNGMNDWYVGDVAVTLTAIDDISGVNATYYKINEGEWEIYADPFVIESDGYYVIEYYSVDNAGNIEDVKSADFKIDQSITNSLSYTFNQDQILLKANVNEYLSGINKVEFYHGGELIGMDYEEPFEAVTNSSINGFYPIKGLIFNPQFYNDSISFYAIIVLIKHQGTVFTSIASDNAGNVNQDNVPFMLLPYIESFQRLTFPNNYFGHIGKFFINARFKF